MIEPEDSLELSLDLFGYLGGAASEGFRVGEPLGAGGKIPLFYNEELYKAETADRAHLVKPDLRPIYGDFSYIPLWQPSQFELRAQYRFRPGLWGSASIAYVADPVAVEAEEALHAPLIEEAFLKWAPSPLPGLAVSVGQLHVTGSYSAVFDQFPLLHAELAGLNAGYIRETSLGRWEFLGVVGRDVLGRTKRLTRAVGWEVVDPLTSSYLAGVRARNRFLASARFSLASGFYASAIAEYQALPEDSTSYSPVSAAFTSRLWPYSSGYQIGGEAGWEGPSWNHHLALSFGKGDVRMAGAGPDPVYRVTKAPDESPWTWEGSSISQAVWWSDFQKGPWIISGGAWAQWRDPSRLAGMTVDSTALRARRFRAFKLALEPAWRCGGALFLGARYDRIQYLDPRAHTNTSEPQTDEALRGFVIVTDGIPTQIVGPSRWEREAADCHILSPFVQLELGGDFHARAAWSGAWYSKEITRQGSADAYHANASLAVWFTHRFGR